MQIFYAHILCRYFMHIFYAHIYAHILISTERETKHFSPFLTNSPGRQSLSVSWYILQKSSPVVPILIASILFHFSQRSSSSLYCGFYTFHPSFSWSSNWSFCIRLQLQIHLLFSLFIHSHYMTIPSQFHSFHLFQKWYNSEFLSYCGDSYSVPPCHTDYCSQYSHLCSLETRLCLRCQRPNLCSIQ